MAATQELTRRALVELSEDQRERAMSRLQVLLPHLDDGVPVTRAASAAGVPLRTARRWLAAYRAQRLAGLAPPPRSDRASRRFRPELVGLVEGLYLRRPAPSWRPCTGRHSRAWLAVAELQHGAGHRRR